MIEFRDLPGVLVDREDSIRSWLEDVGVEYGIRIKSLQYTFLDDEGIRDMNAKHLDHDYATDIITFGYKDGKRISGEIYIGMETVEDNAVFLGVDYSDELCRVIVHGLLHLIGFDDHSDDEKRVMRGEEEKCLILRPKILNNKTL